MKQKPKQPPDFIGKIPPRNVEVERQLLGTVITYPDTLNEIIQIFRPEVFYKDSHATICKAIRQLWEDRAQVDTLTVVAMLKKSGELEQVGGAYELSTLSNSVIESTPTTYMAIIYQAFILRTIIAVSDRCQRMAFENSADEFEILNDWEAELTGLNDLLHGFKKQESKAEVIDRRVQERINNNGQRPMGISTGMAKLDEITNGWEGGDLVIIGARPSMGKTALALFFSIQAAKHGSRCLYFNFEMSHEQIIDRMITICDGYSFTNGGNMLKQMPVEPISTSGVGVDFIISKTFEARRSAGVDIIFVDYLQRMDLPSGQENTNEKIGYITKRLKDIAKELNIPVILLSQLNREVEKRSTKKGVMSDLRDSGNIEQDADKVLFPFHPAYYSNEVSKELYEIDIQKNRNGKVGGMLATVNDDFTAFAERFEFEANKENDGRYF